MLPAPSPPAAIALAPKARLQADYEYVDKRVIVAFWLFGLTNNVLFVIILSAALDLVGASVPKSTVLLFDIVPSLLAKLIAPYVLHRISYTTRIIGFGVLPSICGMLLVVLSSGTPTEGIATKMLGVVLASFASGAGELSFLGLTHYYGRPSLAAWGSGTGAAGLVGAGAYAFATTSIGLSIQTSLLLSTCLPLGMAVCWLAVLPREVLGDAPAVLGHGYGPLQQNDDDGLDLQADSVRLSLSSCEVDDINHTPDSSSSLIVRGLQAEARSEAGVLSSSSSSSFKASQTPTQKFHEVAQLFFPYMLPLLLVYFSEYLINQGVSPTLLFPLESSPFSSYRDFYPTYATIYQTGVFISRSSIALFRIHHLYTPSFLQLGNLILLTLHALLNFIPSVWIIFCIMFFEGLLGGLVYISTFSAIIDNVPEKDREFSLSATSVSDSAGVCLAGLVGMPMEIWLCKYQVAHGRDYCRKM